MIAVRNRADAAREKRASRTPYRDLKHYCDYLAPQVALGQAAASP